MALTPHVAVAVTVVIVYVAEYSVVVGASDSSVRLVTVSKDVVMGYEKQWHADERTLLPLEEYGRKHLGAGPSARLSKSEASSAAQSIGSSAAVGSGARASSTSASSCLSGHPGAAVGSGTRGSSISNSPRRLRPPGPCVGHEPTETVVSV